LSSPEISAKSVIPPEHPQDVSGIVDAFADVDTFVDEVLTELAALALTAEGTRPTRSGPKPPLAGAALAQGDHGDLVRWLLRPAVARHRLTLQLQR
jgi:hypothetical protein